MIVDNNQTIQKHTKRKYTKHFAALKSKHEQILIQHLRDEWEQAEKALKKHEQIQRAKHLGLEVGKWVLMLGLLAGTVTIATVAPNAFGAVLKMTTGTKRHYASLSQSKFDKQIIQGSKKKYWRYTKDKSSGIYLLTLTKLGKAVALRAEMRRFKLHEQPVWDGKWRLVMFDIPKKYSGTRDTLRRKLKEIGMHGIQESVFVYPYQCHDEVMMWVELFGMEKYVETAEASVSPGLDDELKQVFRGCNLKSSK